MFCTRCGQQQFQEGLRFCSGCGVQLAEVSQSYENGGMNFIQPSYRKERLPLIKRQELRKGAKLIFASFFLIIPCAILTGIFDNGLPLLLIPITFLIGLAQIAYYLLFGESILRVKQQEQSFEFNENSQQFNFQQAQCLPFSFVDSRSLNTAEFRQPFGASTRPTEILNHK